MNDVNEFLKNKLRADLPDDFLFTEQFGSYMVNFTMKDLREWMSEYKDKVEEDYFWRTREL